MTLPSTTSITEKYFLKKSSVQFLDSTVEKIPVVTAENYVELGRLTAIRFLEWVCENPQGVVSLPTGRTPEYFIKWVNYYLKNWKKEVSSGLLGKIGFSTSTPPTMKELHFVQIDEFFPMDPAHERSFYYYVNKYYIQGFGLDPHKALLINTFDICCCLSKSNDNSVDLSELFKDGVDFSLRLRQPCNERETLQREIIKRVDMFCEEYEKKIRLWGGIGFFLGGLGPDGHIAFNVRGSSHYSCTRLAAMNYETMAAAAQDLGGIEAARKKAVITIGLETITYNPNVTAIIIAAGDAKAKAVSAAIENAPHIDYPASCLQKLPKARFFLTPGAASKLRARICKHLIKTKNVAHADIEKLVIDSATELSRSLVDCANIPKNTTAASNLHLAAKLSQTPLPSLVSTVAKSILNKIEAGLKVPKNQKILHTGPHHDDIELAYFPYIHHLVRSPDNKNFFCYLTSGFTSVTNSYLCNKLKILKRLLLKGELFCCMPRTNLLNLSLAYQDIHGYLNAIGQQNEDAQDLYASCRLCRNLFSYLKTDSDVSVLSFLEEQISQIEALSPGKPASDTINTIKGWIREWEAELVWEHFGLGIDNVYHLRLEFYKDQIFPEDPEFERDVVPILTLLEKIKPTIVTLALDPEGSGPDTHYKVLMALRAALENYVSKYGNKNLRIWGYRNVWSRFHISEVNTIIPVSLNSFAVLHNMFNACFKSQASASFPSFELDGTFAALAQKIWVEQFNQLTLLLGKNVFSASNHPMMRRAFGAIYLKDMEYEEFIDQTNNLKKLAATKEKMKLISI